MNGPTEPEVHVAPRQDKRHDGHFRDLSITYEGQLEQVPHRPPDLSVRGMFIQTSHHFPEGAVLKVKFRLVCSQLELQLRGEVPYCLIGVGVGVEFIGISPEARQAIEEELRENEPVPRRKR